MGKGDIKSKRGKIVNGSYGVRRRRKNANKPLTSTNNAVVVKEAVKKEVIKKEVVKKEAKKEVAVKEVVKKEAAVKELAKKETAKKKVKEEDKEKSK